MSDPLELPAGTSAAVADAARAGWDAIRQGDDALAELDAAVDAGSPIDAKDTAVMARRLHFPRRH